MFACTGGDGGEAGAFGTQGSDTTGETGGEGSAGTATDTGAEDGEETGADDGPKFDVGGADVGPDKPDESTCAAVEESLSSAGCLFAPFVGRSFWEEPWAVVAANAGDNPANVTLTDKDGNLVEAAVVDPGETHVFEFAAASPELMAHVNKQATQLERKAMILESDVPIRLLDQGFVFRHGREALYDPWREATCTIPVGLGAGVHAAARGHGRRV